MKKRVGLDVDGVLANFAQGVIEKALEMSLHDHFPANWQEVKTWGMSEKFADIWKEIETDINFWLQLKPLPYSLPLDFVPDCYITSRPIRSDITEMWLRKYGFPEAQAITVKDAKVKAIHVRERNLDLFVDDLIPTVRMMREAGINAVLFEAPYQQSEDHSDLPKIKTLGEVNELLARS